MSANTGPARDAFEGCILGLAIGDALGFPAEFRKRVQILEAFPPAGLSDFVSVLDPAWPPRPLVLGAAHPPGTYSDDTQMTIAVAEALLDARAARDDDPEALGARLAARFVAWSVAPDNDRSPGNACMTGCANLARGVPWRAAGVPDSKGCGSAMRVAPIGLVYRRDVSRLMAMARMSSVLTHGHDAAIEGAAAAALLVSLALDGATPDAMHAAVMAQCAPNSRDLRRCFERIPDLLTAPPEVALSKRGLGEGWVAEEAVACALWCYWRMPHDFAATVLLGANTDGDSDSIACIAGSIAGAALGGSAIPARWRERVENAAGLRALAARLYDAAL